MSKKKVKNEEIFYRLPYGNRYILGYVSNELSIEIHTLFAFMNCDEIKHMKTLVE